MVVIQFSDFQCPACEHFALRMWPSFRHKWIDSSRVQMAFTHFPVNPVHDKAARAAEGASCAALQGRFWPMHDRLFGSGRRLAEDDLRVYADAVGVDQAQFDQCMSVAGKQIVADDVRLAKSLGIRATPTFMVGRRTNTASVQITSILEGVPPESVFELAFQAATRPSSTTGARQ